MTDPLAPAPEPSAVERGSQDTEALIARHKPGPTTDPDTEETADTGHCGGCGFPWPCDTSVLAGALVAARADVDRQRGIYETELAAEFDRCEALRADVDRLTERVRLEADVNDRLATWQEQAEADLAVLRGQRDAALALAAEFNNSNHYRGYQFSRALDAALGASGVSDDTGLHGVPTDG